MRFVELEAGELRQFEQKSPYGNLYQMAERAEVRRRMGWQAWLFGVKDAEKVLAACVAFEKDGPAAGEVLVGWVNRGGETAQGGDSGSFSAAVTIEARCTW